MPSDTYINLTIKVIPEGNEFDVECPISTTCKELIEELVNERIVPEHDGEKNSIQYLLKLKNSNNILEYKKSLQELNIKNNETITISPKNLSDKQEIKIKRRNNTDSILQLTIRIMPQGEEVEIEIPNITTGKELIKYLFERNLAPRYDTNGNPYIYELVSKKTNSKIYDDKSLKECFIKNDEIIYFMPKLVAGGKPKQATKSIGNKTTASNTSWHERISSYFKIGKVKEENIYDELDDSVEPKGKLAYYLPTKAKINQRVKCNIRIAKKELADYIIKESLEPESELKGIEIGELMIVTLKENSINEHLIINALSTEEQSIQSGSFTEWVFELLPKKVGFTSLMLRVTMKVLVEGFGERKKDVLLICHELEITNNVVAGQECYFNQFTQLYEWTDSFKDKIYNLIKNNETGLALTNLINIFQKYDLDIFNMMVLLQSQWNEGRNKNLLNLISINDWMMIQTKVNFGILELMKNLENGNNSKIVLEDPIANMNQQMSNLLK